MVAAVQVTAKIGIACMWKIGSPFPRAAAATRDEGTDLKAALARFAVGGLVVVAVHR